jgi:superfamily II DNA or RNA helicase
MNDAPTVLEQTTLVIYIKQALYLKADSLPLALWDNIIQTLTIKNPAYIQAEKAGRWTGNISRLLKYYELHANGNGEEDLVLPRGFLPSLLHYAKQHQLQWTLHDYTHTIDPVEFNSTIQLRDYQLPAVETAIEKGGGVIVSPAGSGKTVMGLELIARLRQPALWVTHTKELLYQAIDRAVEFLQLQKDEIGIYGAGKKTIGDRLTVGLVQTLVRGIPEELLSGVGTVILDEAHHCPASSFLDVVSNFPAKYRYGLTATPYRKDGLTKPMYWTLGYKIYEVVTDTLMDAGKVIRPAVKFIETNFWYDYADDYAAMLTALAEDSERNQLIIQRLSTEAIGGHYCLVLSERVDHCYVLQHLLSEAAPNISSAVLVGSVPKTKRQEIIERLRSKDIQVIFATNPLAEEGLDLPHLDRLFLTCPSRNKRKVIQAVGRIMRPCEGKVDAVVFDFIDPEVGLLESQARSRRRMYEELQ